MILATTTLLMATSSLATSTSMATSVPVLIEESTSTPIPKLEPATTTPTPIPIPEPKPEEATTTTPATIDPTFPSNFTPAASIYARSSHLSPAATRGLIEGALLLAGIGYLFTESPRVRRILLRMRRKEAIS